MNTEKNNGQSPAEALMPKAPAQSTSKTKQYIAAAAATLGAFSAGTVLAWTSPALPLLQAENSTLPVSDEQGSWIGSLLAVGALGGALPSGYCAELVGRKLTMASLALPFVLSWVLILAANSVALLYVARVVAGVAIGAISVTAPMYIGEIAESTVRGALGSFFQLMLTVGILYTYVFGALPYMWLAGLSLIVPVVFLAVFINMPESPAYLLKKKKYSEARRALQWLRAADYNVTDEMASMQQAIDDEVNNTASLKDVITSRATVRALVIVLGLMLFQQLSGINAVIFYTANIFEAAGSTLSPTIATIIVGIFQVVFTYVSTLLVDRFGRRILLLSSAAVMAGCLGVLGLFFHLKDNEHDVSSIGWLPLLSMVVFIVMFSLGFGPIPWIMMGEVFPGNVKGAASGLAVTLNWILVFIVTKTFQNLVDALGLNFTFWLFAIICIVNFLFVFFSVPETKGKSLQDIQDELSGKRRKQNGVV